MKTINDTTVSEVMSRSLSYVAESATIAEAVRLMVTARVSSLIVEKAHEHDAYGIITRKDIVVEGAENWDNFASLRVHDLATKPVITVQGDLGVKHAIRLMRLVGVRRLLVTQNDKVVGVVSNSDVFRRMEQLMNGEAP